MARAEKGIVVPERSVVLDATVIPPESTAPSLPIQAIAVRAAESTTGAGGKSTAIDLFTPTQEPSQGPKVFATDRELHPLRPEDVDWTGWIDRYGPKKAAWRETAERVTDSATVDPAGFREYADHADPDAQQRLVELLTFTKDGGVDTAPLAFAGILASYYRPDDEEGPLFEERRRQFLSNFSLPFPTDSVGRSNLERALGIFFAHAERDEETRRAIQADKDRLILYNLMPLLPKDANTSLVKENPGVFAALGGRRSYTLQNMVDLNELPSTPLPEGERRKSIA